MREIKLKKAIEVIGGRYFGGKELSGRSLSGVSVDSRKIKENELFFALEGKNFSGKTFAPDAVFKSKLPAVVPEKIKCGEFIIVDNPLKSLGDLASYYKKETDAFTIAVTGSYGKTTTKDFLGSIFSTSYSTLVSYRNYNNLIGVPLNLFRLENESVAILEFGTNQFGEIERLSQITNPDIGVITGIGSAHLEAFKDKKGVLREKTDISAGLKGPLFVNGDDPMLNTIKGKKVVKIGFSEENNITFKVLQESADGTIFSVEGMDFWIKLPTVGMLRCAMLAVSIAIFYGILPDKIQEGLKKVESASHRMKIIRTEKINIVDDTYNSNPDSVLNAVSFLSLIPGRKIVVLGPMLELGENSYFLHKETGAKLKFKVHNLLAIGNEAKGFVDGFGGGYLALDKEEAFNILQKILEKGDTILFKSSRGLKLETLVERLKEEYCYTYSTL
jgi:UDP-N-acetylmuramoyl-tripeptide--D-alanyl-D-alanine ligase